MTGAIAVPAAVAGITRYTDSVVRDARDPISGIRSRIPGLSDDLPMKRDVFGRRIELEGGVGPGVMSPTSVTTQRNDPTVRALLDAGAHINKLLRKLGKDRDLSDAEYDRYQEVIGSIVKPRLDAFVQSLQWRALSDDHKLASVTSLMKEAGVEARGQLIGVMARSDLLHHQPLPPEFKMDQLPPLPDGLTLGR